MDKNTKFNEDEMFDLFEESDFSKVKQFIKKYGIDSVDRDGRNALLNFIIENKTDFAIKLIDDFKEADLNQQDNSGFSALHFAVQENNKKVVDALLKKDILIDIIDKNGNTPLWRGIFDGINEKLIIELLKKGADIRKKNKHGVSPLELLDDSLPEVQKWVIENSKK